jgi:hypothetical protein
MQYNRDEYLLLSRRGSVRARPRGGPRHAADFESFPRARPEVVPRRRLRTVVAGWVRALSALRGGVQATWTAFGNGGRDL